MKHAKNCMCSACRAPVLYAADYYTDESHVIAQSICFNGTTWLVNYLAARLETPRAKNMRGVKGVMLFCEWNAKARLWHDRRHSKSKRANKRADKPTRKAAVL